MAPDSLVAKTQSAYVDFQWKGDITALRKAMASIPPDEDPDGSVTSVKWDGAMLERDFNTAKQVLDSTPLTEISYLTGGLTPKSFLAGCTALALHDATSAKDNFEAARKAFESAAAEAPNNADRHAGLGLCLAFMGRKEDAIREGKRAVELKPESKDALDGAIMNCCLALIYARVGENALAIPLIERLLHTPGAVDSVNYSITINDLKFRWEWDGLRHDPAFQKLISK